MAAGEEVRRGSLMCQRLVKQNECWPDETRRRKIRRIARRGEKKTIWFDLVWYSNVEHNIQSSIFPESSMLSEFRWLWCESDQRPPGLQKKKPNSAGDWLVFMCLIGVCVSDWWYIALHFFAWLSFLSFSGYRCPSKYAEACPIVASMAWPFSQGSDLSLSMHPMMKRSTAQDFKSHVHTTLTEGLQNTNKYICLLAGESGRFWEHCKRIPDTLK